LKDQTDKKTRVKKNTNLEEFSKPGLISKKKKLNFPQFKIYCVHLININKNIKSMAKIPWKHGATRTRINVIRKVVLLFFFFCFGSFSISVTKLLFFFNLVLLHCVNEKLGSISPPFLRME